MEDVNFALFANKTVKQLDFPLTSTSRNYRKNRTQNPDSQKLPHNTLWGLLVYGEAEKELSTASQHNARQAETDSRDRSQLTNRRGWAGRRTKGVLGGARGFGGRGSWGGPDSSVPSPEAAV